MVADQQPSRRRAIGRSKRDRWPATCGDRPQFIDRYGDARREYGAYRLPAHRERGPTQHSHGVGIEVEYGSGVLIHTKNDGIGVQHRFQCPQPALAEVAAPGVVGTALGIVVVRDHRRA